MLRLILLLLLLYVFCLGNFQLIALCVPSTTFHFFSIRNFWSDIYIIITQFICTPLYGVCVFSCLSSFHSLHLLVVVLLSLLLLLLHSFSFLSEECYCYSVFIFDFCFHAHEHDGCASQQTLLTPVLSLSLCERGEWETPLRILFRLDPPYFCIFFSLQKWLEIQMNERPEYATRQQFQPLNLYGARSKSENWQKQNKIETGKMRAKFVVVGLKWLKWLVASTARPLYRAILNFLCYFSLFSVFVFVRCCCIVVVVDVVPGIRLVRSTKW